MTVTQDNSSDKAVAPTFGPFAPAIEYMLDAAQRSVLFWDVMRQSGNQYQEHLAEVAPHVLSYAAELVIDGRTLDRPVNYALVRIIPLLRRGRSPAALCRRDPGRHGPGTAACR